MDMIAMWDGFWLWAEAHQGAASWFQAVGAVVSIGAAWSIARSQSKKIENADRQRDKAKCAAVIGVLTHAQSMVESYMGMSNDQAKNSMFLNETSRILSMLNGVDLFSLPSPVLVNALCIARQKFELVEYELKNPLNRGMLYVVFPQAFGRSIIKALQDEIARCKMTLATI
ncbi:hypothetical protein PFLL34_04244 [Pseudomonas fluorescens]|uniref:hypothetical protein n=1 Tax=Pseudomonas fluorescens TaxID=294 RepID=UPI000762D756|nr:hypothetical protein [Pseudomonas fluorescens]KWV77725.1 hypothetical protein PFLL34_04244 [Pseudomonas fluorescens]